MRNPHIAYGGRSKSQTKQPHCHCGSKTDIFHVVNFCIELICSSRLQFINHNDGALLVPATLATLIGIYQEAIKPTSLSLSL